MSSPLPTHPPTPQPTLPSINQLLHEVAGGLLCVSPAHLPYEFCISPYGCYTVYDSVELEVVNRTCIETPDFNLCIRERVVHDDRFAECCYDRHYCNSRRSTRSNSNRSK